MRWWTRESWRQILPVPLAAIGGLVPGDTLVKVLAGWDIYAVVYLLLTWLAYRRREPSALREMALAARRRPLADRLFATTPQEFSQGAAAVALIATVIAMPQARRLGASPPLVLAVCLVAVVTSWLILQAGFAVAYLNQYVTEGGLRFPGDDEPVMVDFVYFAVSVGTTFGTTDVDVTHRRMRRQVLAHGVLAFLFNALIVAVAVTILTSYIAGA